MSKPDIRALALAPLGGFRHRRLEVAEWEDAQVIVREMSPGEWSEFRRMSLSMLKSAREEDGTAPAAPAGGADAEGGDDTDVSQEAGKGMDAAMEGREGPAEARALKWLDAWVITRVLLEPNGKPVFMDTDIDMIVENYGPVYSRLINVAMDLAGVGLPQSQAVAEAKKD